MFNQHTPVLNIARVFRNLLILHRIMQSLIRKLNKLQNIGKRLFGCGRKSTKTACIYKHRTQNFGFSLIQHQSLFLNLAGIPFCYFFSLDARCNYSLYKWYFTSIKGIIH